MATFTTQVEPKQKIDFFELVDNPSSPRFTFTDDASFATRVIDVAWGTFPRFVNDVLGYSLVKTAVNTTDEDNRTVVGMPFVSRVLPWAIPFKNSANNYWLFASKVDVEGVGVPSNNIMYEQGGRDQIAFYNKARCTIQYATRMYDILADSEINRYDESGLQRYVTKLYRPEGEFLTIDGSAYYYGGIRQNGQPVPLARGVNKSLVKFNIALTWHKIPKDGVPSNFINPGCSNPAIDVSLGRVNNAVFSGCEKGTLLLTAVELKPIVGALGDRYYDITYYMKFFNPTKDLRNNNPIGHQHVFRPFGTPGWYEALGGTAGRTLATAANPTNFVAMATDINIYNWQNFRNLFRPATHLGPATN